MAKRHGWSMIALTAGILWLTATGAWAAANTLNAYSIWPENWARPMFQEFEKATGIKVNFVRFSSGEALARVIAEKNNPRVDVLFGGPVETYSAGIKEGVFEPYKPPTFGVLAGPLQGPGRLLGRDRRRPAGLHEQQQVPEGEQAQAARLVGRPAQPRLQGHAPDGRRPHLGHGGDPDLLHPRGQRPRRGQGLRLHEEAARRTSRSTPRAAAAGPSRWASARRAAGIFFIVDALKTKAGGLRRGDLLPEGGHRHLRRGHRAAQGRQEPRARQEADRLGHAARPCRTSSPSTRSTSSPAHPDGEDRAQPGRGHSRAPRSSRSTTPTRAPTASASWTAGSARCSTRRVDRWTPPAAPPPRRPRAGRPGPRPGAPAERRGPLGAAGRSSSSSRWSASCVAGLRRTAAGFSLAPLLDILSRPEPPPRLLEQPAAGGARGRWPARSSASSSPSPPCAPNLSRRWVDAARRRHHSCRSSRRPSRRPSP